MGDQSESYTRDGFINKHLLSTGINNEQSFHIIISLQHHKGADIWTQIWAKTFKSRLIITLQEILNMSTSTGMEIED